MAMKFDIKLIKKLIGIGIFGSLVHGFIAGPLAGIIPEFSFWMLSLTGILTFGIAFLIAEWLHANTIGKM